MTYRQVIGIVSNAIFYAVILIAKFNIKRYKKFIKDLLYYIRQDMNNCKSFKNLITIEYILPILHSIIFSRYYFFIPLIRDGKLLFLTTQYRNVKYKLGHQILKMQY